MDSLLFPIIMLAVTLTGGGILLLFLKTARKRPQMDADSAAIQTAQQFINVKDIRDKYLYTRDGMVFVYLRIQAISIDLYSRAEKNALIKTLTAELSDIQYPFKFMALSRPVDISPLITEMGEMLKGRRTSGKSCYGRKSCRWVALPCQGRSWNGSSILRFGRNRRKEPKGSC